MKLMLVAVAAGVSFLICTTGIAAVKNNDNTRPAGQPRGNVVAIDMVADSDTWRPDGSKGVALAIAAFGEEVGALSVPGPLIRVRAGSTVALRLRNRLEQDLHVHGLCSRPGKCAEVSIAAGASRELRFELNAAGTYYYWASTGAARPGLRSRFESQLNGAIVVDPPDQPPADRVFVISTYDDPLPVAAGDPRILGVPTPGIPRVFAINGASWPHTERLSYPVGQTVHWRIINLGNIGHAMHLHGYYFQVEARGDGISDDAYRAEQRIAEVTEVIGPARTFAMSWLPARPGNWLFHCHMTEHMSASDAHAHSPAEHDGAAGMAGLVLGIRVTGPPVASAPAAARRLRMILTEEANRYGNRPGYRVAVQGGATAQLDEGPVPGPGSCFTGESRSKSKSSIDSPSLRPSTGTASSSTAITMAYLDMPEMVIISRRRLLRDNRSSRALRRRVPERLSTIRIGTMMHSLRAACMGHCSSLNLESNTIRPSIISS